MLNGNKFSRVRHARRRGRLCAREERDLRVGLAHDPQAIASVVRRDLIVFRVTDVIKIPVDESRHLRNEDGREETRAFVTRDER